MPAPQGLLNFPGITRVLDWRYANTVGIAAGTASLTIAPQDEDIPSDEQTMSITYGDSDPIIFRNCIVDQASMTINDSGQIVSLAILDRRWKWKYGKISGRYNVKLKNGNVDPDTEKTPQELATLCLKAMNEPQYDVSGLSSLPRPEVHWDFANPAHELQELATSMGCTVAMANDGSVSTPIIGQGDDLPDLPSKRNISFGVNPPDRPDSLLLVFGPTEYQTTFRLQAVGQEPDDVTGGTPDLQGNLVGFTTVGQGAWKPINQLSYAPPNGFTSEHGGNFGYIGSGTFGKDWKRILARAQETVYKCYRIVGTPPFQPPGITGSSSGASSAGAGASAFTIPGYTDADGNPGVVNKLWQLLPLMPGLVDVYLEAVADGLALNSKSQTETPLPAQVFGKWFQNSPNLANSNIIRRYPFPFTIDHERGIVKFSEPLVNNYSSTTKEAELYLTIGHHVKDVSTMVEDRKTVSRDLPGDSSGAGPLVINKPDITRKVIATYDDVLSVKDIVYNDPTNDLAATYYLNATQAQFQTLQTLTVEYSEIVDISPGGYIRQVEWKGGTNSGAITTAGANTEHSLIVPSFKERQRLSRIQHGLVKTVTPSAPPLGGGK